MTKINVLWLILDSIFLIGFNVFFFVLGGTDHNLSVWISYGFIHLAYILLLLTPKLVRGGKSRAIFGFTLYVISSAYFLVQLFIGTIFILIAPASINAALLTQLAIAGLYGIILIINMIANERTADVEEKRQYEIDFVKNASVRVKALTGNIKDRKARKKVESVYDAIYSSPVKSHPNLAQMENYILASINELEVAVSSGDDDKIVSLASALLSEVNERNMKLKTLN